MHAFDGHSYRWAAVSAALCAGCGGGELVTVKYDIATPVRLGGAPAMVQIGLGDGHSCMLSAAGQAWCWGSNDAGQLASASRAACGDDDTFACSSTPLAVGGTPALTAIDGGRFSTCALAVDGRAWCWGGASDLAPRSVPTPVGSADDRFVQIDVATFGGDACGVKADGSAWCWGAASLGTLQRVAPGLALSRIAVGDLHACALDTQGQAWCWRTVSYPILGESAFTGSALAPVAVADGRRYQWIGVGMQYACALDLDGAAWCWGSGAELGVGDANAWRPQPAAVAGPHFTQLRTGTTHACGLATDGQAWCWGQNLGGAVGDGSTTDRAAPVRVAGGHSFRELGVGGAASCGIATDGSSWCWGWNMLGAVGQPAVGHEVPL